MDQKQESTSFDGNPARKAAMHAGSSEGGRGEDSLVF
jgi:hypothetical protein